jgi:hypothetical protein
VPQVQALFIRSSRLCPRLAGPSEDHVEDRTEAVRARDPIERRRASRLRSRAEVTREPFQGRKQEAVWFHFSHVLSVHGPAAFRAQAGMNSTDPAAGDIEQANSVAVDAAQRATKYRL